MLKSLKRLAPVLLALMLPVPAFAQAVDVALVLTADVSLSVNDPVFLLQRHGYVSALMSPKVIDAIKAGPNKAVAISFVEWSNEKQQKVVVDWTVIRNESDAAAFTVELLMAPRSFKDYASLSGAIDFAVGYFAQAGLAPQRRVVMIMADGTNAAGRPVTAARDAAVAAGVTIDGFAITNLAPKWKHIEHTQPKEGLARYFRDNVIGGPGASVSVLDNASLSSVDEVIAEALARQIAGASETAAPREVKAPR
jgi:hypothetical protein